MLLIADFSFYLFLPCKASHTVGTALLTLIKQNIMQMRLPYTLPLFPCLVDELGLSGIFLRPLNQLMRPDPGWEVSRDRRWSQTCNGS